MKFLRLSKRPRAWLRTTLALCAILGLSVGQALAQSRIKTAEQYTVLSYHEIAEQADALIPDYAVTPENFKSQMELLRDNHYHFISVSDIIAAKASRKALPDRSVLITFDDGYMSVYRHAFPLLRAMKIPSVVAVVGSWEEDKKVVDFDGKKISRGQLMSWTELRAMAKSGLVEIGSHSYDLHHGLQANPQGNMEPAATARRYLVNTKSYETEAQYRARVTDDLTKSRDIIKKRIGVAPRVIAWPYGRYSYLLRDVADKLGMTVGLTLDDGANVENTPLWGVRRVLVERTMTIDGLRNEIDKRNQNFTDNDIPQKIAHIDLDNIYDPDPAQQERNLGDLLDRLQNLYVNTVYLQAFADPDANGSADAVYFPSRHMPMRADLFNRVAWQIETRTQVKHIYAWMPLLAWELPANEPAARDVVTALPSDTSGRVDMGYKRLSPFSPRARQTIREIYEDLSRSATFEGVLFHDDTTLSDYEDTSDFALKQYQDWKLPASVQDIRNDKKLFQRWTILKTKAIDKFASEMTQTLRAEEPAIRTARNLYAQVALNPDAQEWYGQSLVDSIENYDFTAIMAMPYMEQAADHAKFYANLINRVKKIPGGMKKTVFEVQTVDWRKSSAPIPDEEIAATIKDLYAQGVEHIGYYPDDVNDDHPGWSAMRHAFSVKVQPSATQSAVTQKVAKQIGAKK